jgi:DNA adenine methylase
VTKIVGATPIVKWAGGKTRLLPELVKRVPQSFGRYLEPFAGGAALFFRLHSMGRIQQAGLADANQDLMNLYCEIRGNVENVINRLAILASEHNEDCYYATRDRWNVSRSHWLPSTQAATFIYLNKTCFNGLWRVNRAGAFNVPMGRYANPTICDPDALRAASAALQITGLQSLDYKITASSADPGDFVYFDPPYVPATKTSSFTSYTEGAFGLEQQQELADTARELAGRGVRVMLSNSDVPVVRQLYKGFKIETVKCSRAINSKGASRGQVDEVIITSKLLSACKR